MDKIMIEINHVAKKYKLGQIGGTTLRDEIQRKKAKWLNKEDPTVKIGTKRGNENEVFYALKDISFKVDKGERVGVIGHNGAGKSTLLKLLSRVTAPTSGQIGLNGRVASMLEVGTGFHAELTGRENIYMNGAILGMTKKEIDAKMEDIIEFSECRQFIDTPVKRYSSGMYVKLAFSVAAHLDSEIMIMDEVLAVGDMAFQKKCLEKMSNVSKTEGRTILYVSHNMNTIRQLCERVVVLDHGYVVFDGDVEEGIQLYLGSKVKSETKTILSEMPRDGEFSDHSITMTEIEVLNSVSSVFKVGEKIDLSLCYISNRYVEETYIRVMVKTLDGLPVTMYTVDNGFISKPMVEEKIGFEMDISLLTPGKYTISLMMYEVDQFGNNIALDGLKEVYCFEIIQTPGFNNNMMWESRNWGHFYNAPLEIKKIEN